ncbi:TPA: sugar transporter [Citrobacter freundii]|jgi:capsular polysaccharide transport system permease protein|uniref:sugar transporter n=1 Tax=Citrobacter freundii complex TaxID=1344959 RepID=UPI0011DD4E37|nr:MULTISPECIES: sugar transporter [Citrobacter freundii complex]MBJ9315709.1 sugar transporter [Citrobacter freundii]MDX6983907.1 sugar transporter [Citrobacter freundii]QEH54669.1 sugar transporter [Citrobacter portucalensis]QKX80340.1 sugar transporter [Citrobacter freundii]HEI8945094.1 sugar transporter [Citrobacter freundii]
MNQPTRLNKASGMMRKLHKLKTKPKHFIVDSSGYRLAKHSWKQSLKLGSFMWVVALFTIAVVYFCLIASDRYVSRAELVVKQADQIKMLPDALSMLGIGGSNHEDILLIQDYLKSPDLIGKLDKELSLKAHYQSHNVDYFSRLSDNVSREEFIQYYRNHLTLRLDDISGVLTIEFQAFDPAYGKRVVDLMLKESEGFINKLGHQVALEQLAFVEKEVNRAYQRVQDEKAKVLDFQNTHHLLSPESTSTARLGVVSQIEGQLAQQQAQLKQLQSYMRDTAPAVISVQARVDALNQQLEQEKARLTGVDKDAMNEVTARYMDVQTQANLAADLYKSGLISLEQARVEAYRKLKHLLVVSQPTLAEDAEYPRRLYNLATIGVLLCLLYGLSVMGLATLREHQD